jgi:hypothetical protein
MHQILMEQVIKRFLLIPLGGQQFAQMEHIKGKERSVKPRLLKKNKFQEIAVINSLSLVYIITGILKINCIPTGIFT